MSRRGKARTFVAPVAVLAITVCTQSGAQAAVGWQHGNSSTRIYGGSPAGPGILPFVVGVLFDTEQGGENCTGTVIGPTAVLTATHCTYDPVTKQPLPASTFVVVVGARRLAPLRPADAQFIPVTAVRAYAGPDDSSPGDVAVLELARPAPVEPVSIATTADARLYEGGRRVVVAGFGDSGGSGPPSSRLMHGSLTVRPNIVCNRLSTFVPAVQLCAAGPGFRPAICFGDSGGPLLASTSRGWVEIGVASFGIGGVCGAHPDYYVRVASLEPWIMAAAAGRPGPRAVDPPLNAPATAVLRRSGTGVVVSFPAVRADPGTVGEGYTVVLQDARGKPVAHAELGEARNSWVVSGLPAGTYSATVRARYTAGSSAEVTSTPVTIGTTAGGG